MNYFIIINGCLILESVVTLISLSIFRLCFAFLMMFKLFEYPFIDTWCNGSTTDFGSVSSGSNPDVSTM